eukprot:TRINITY_DN12931_c0_g1_i1.p1 TRINITY_DN12931_c0_g1~~TRINITY_DN12931_c0_g1_i1.p1  ORF type:complete len:139 (+),score=19.41 TRINITY_DN12931_c0_g1_i1:24-419(+)
MENSVTNPQLLLLALQPIKPSGAVCTWLGLSLEVPYGFGEFAAGLLHVGHGSFLRPGERGSCFLRGLVQNGTTLLPDDHVSIFKAWLQVLRVVSPNACAHQASEYAIEANHVRSRREALAAQCFLSSSLSR